jgi:GNAT superfamily N-acetyltransferase
MNAVSIERLTSGNEERLRAIRLRALADAPDAFGTTYDEALARSAEDWRLQLALFANFIAVAAGHDVGIIRGAPDDERPDTAYLLSMWVAPEMRRQKIASVLIDSVVQWAKSHGYRRVILDVAEVNAAALALYFNKGFVTNGNSGTLPPPRQHIREFQMELTLISDESSN